MIEPYTLRPRAYPPPNPLELHLVVGSSSSLLVGLKNEEQFETQGHA